MFLELPITVQSWKGTLGVKYLGNFHDVSLSDYACITLSGYLFSNPMIISRETFLEHIKCVAHTKM